MIDYKKMNSVCFVFLQGIGDFIMFTPALNKIKIINPSIKISIVLRKELGLKALAENTGLFESVHEIPLAKQPVFYIPWIFWLNDYWIIREELKRLFETFKPEYVKIIYTQLLPTIVYKVLCPGRIKKHKIDRFAAEAGAMLTEAEKNSPIIVIPRDISDAFGGEVDGLPGMSEAVLIGIHRNTADRTRFIDIDVVREFIDKLNAGKEKHYFIIFADRNSYDLEWNRDGKHLSAPNLKYSFELLGDKDSLHMAALIKRCDFIISIDSSVFNIAGALGKNTIGIFNTYKVHSNQRRLNRSNMLCIDKSKVAAADLMEKYYLLKALQM